MPLPSQSRSQAPEEVRAARQSGGLSQAKAGISSIQLAELSNSEKHGTDECTQSFLELFRIKVVMRNARSKLRVY